MSSARPGPSTARSDGQRNKRLIVDAAAAALMENPQASISEIADRAGLTRATVYRHYPDRDGLVRAVALMASREIVPELLKTMRALSWNESMQLLAEQAMALGARYHDLILMVAPHLEETARITVEGEPIQAEIAARRELGEITSPLSDAWLALCIRSLCLAGIGRLTHQGQDVAEATAELATALQRLSS